MMTSSTRGPWTPSILASTMSEVADGPEIQVCVVVASRRENASGTSWTICRSSVDALFRSEIADASERKRTSPAEIVGDAVLRRPQTREHPLCPDCRSRPDSRQVTNLLEMNLTSNSTFCTIFRGGSEGENRCHPTFYVRTAL